jgi:glycosyltransferase involved in cell wall biosynthesis
MRRGTASRDLVGGLRVGLIAPPWVPVPPPVYGGTELVVDILARGLQAAGCRVVLFTTGDATCPVPRRSLYPHALGTDAGPYLEDAHAALAYRELASVDIVHDHTAVGPSLTGFHPAGTPVVTTAHGMFTPENRDRYARSADAGVAVVAISDAQRRTAPEVHVAAVIPHGIEVERVPLGDGRGGYVAFLGRMSPDKGAHRAIDIARAAGKPIMLAAKMQRPEERHYFAEHVEPRLGPDAVYLGEVGGRRKAALLAGAEALVNPIGWPEPFGLVMVEALACGTPVLAFAEGAAPEIVEDGRTGFLCGSDADMVAGLARLGEIDRAACRASASARFSADRMVEDHLALYQRLVNNTPRDLVTIG